VADVQSNIEVNLDASQALAQLKSLQAQLSQFNNAIATSNKAAARAQANLTSNLINSVNATGKFAASITTIKSSTDSFTDSLEKNKFSTREYFRYAGGATKTFGKLFKTEFNTIGKVAEERVKTMQTQYIKMGRDANGAIKAIAVRPLTLDMNNLATKTALAAQKQQLLNQLLKQGSTNLLNFGKNTQWAGRQLMVGFTIPLSMLAVSSSKTFMALEKQAIRFKRVYGEMFTTSAETSRALKEVELLAKQFTKYGVAVEKTMQIAADAAATGKMGADLMAQVAQATRLAVLGGVEQEQALETTISLTNAFGIEADKLRGKIDFLNAVENQTVLNIEDLTIAIPKAAPVIRQLGGDVEDLAFFMTAMKEGGINASEGANALKSGLASLINPSKKASAFLADFGVNIKGIVESNKGDIKSTVIQFAQALDTLDPLNRARAIEQLFGKFQFSRLSTLFQNITKDGTQASRTLNLASNSIEELAILSERELAKVENATGTKFKKTMEDLKVTLAPIGEQFLKAVTPIVEFIGKILEKFNGLSDGVKAGIVRFIGIVGLIGPALLMTFGLIANGAANIIKLFITLRKGFMNLGGQSKVLGEQTQYMTSAQIEATTVAASLDQAHSRLRQSFLLETQAANQLTAAYQRGVVAANNFARVNPGMMRPGFTPKKFNKGGLVPGSGNTDTVPAMLTPGEFVVNKKATQENRGLLPALNKGGFVLRGVGTGKFKNIQNPWAGEVKGGPRYDPTLPKFRVGSIEHAKAVVAAQVAAAQPKPPARFIGMPTSAAKATTSRQTLNKISDNVKAGKYGDVPPTDFGTLHQPFTGFSFPARGVGGVYRKPNGDLVVVKPTMDEGTALAEIRATEIVRAAHKMVSPKQTIRTMMDPTDPTGERKFIVIESPYDPRIAAMDGQFSQKDMVKQLVASTLRGDKDLQRANVSGNIVADVGTAGVHDRASGFREFAKVMPSMEEQAMVNLGGVKGGGAKQFFAKETSSLAAKMSPTEYDAAIKKEISETIPRLEKLIKSWDLDPTETIVYQNMIDRLKAGANVDWSKFQPIHAAATFNKGGFVRRFKGTEEEKAAEAARIAANKERTRLRLLAEEQDLLNIRPGGVAGTALLHWEDSHGNNPPVHTRGNMGAARDSLIGLRKSAGYTMVGDQGYNNLTQSNNSARTAGKAFLDLPEPYPLTHEDAIRTEGILENHEETTRQRYLNATPGTTERVKALQAYRMAVVAKEQLSADIRQIVGTATGARAKLAWSTSMGQRVAFAAAISEKQPIGGPVYNEMFDNFMTSSRGQTTTAGVSRSFLPKVDAMWSRTLNPDGSGLAPLTDVGVGPRNKSDGKMPESSQAAPHPKINKPLRESIDATTRQRKEFKTLINVAQSKPGSEDAFVKSVLTGVLKQRGFLVKERRRKNGTPGYGEPETVPALLTPGEFIADRALAQQIGPALQYINAGGKIERRSNGTIVPGTGNKDTVPMMLNQGSFVVNKKSTQENKGFLQGLNKGGFVLRGEGDVNTIIDPITGKEVIDISSLGSYGSDNAEDFDGTKQTPGRRKAAMERLKASKAGQFASRSVKNPTKIARFAPGIGAAGMGASMALGMTGNMEGSMIAMGLSMAAPLMKTQAGALAAALVLVGAGYMYLKKKNEALAAKTMETTQAMGASSKSLNELAIFTNKVTGTELMNRRRADSFSKFQIKPGKTTFGQAYVQSETGQQKIKDIASSMKATNKVDTQEGIASQLATSIASGTLTASQAQSIAAELGKQLNDYSFGISVNAKLISLMGPKGENALEDPIGVRVKLLDTAQNNIANSFANVKNAKLAKFGLFNGASIAKATGTAVGLQSIAIEQSQELLNSFDAQTQKLIEQLEIKKQFGKADELRDKREKQRLDLVEKDRQINEQVVKFFDDVETTSTKTATSLLRTSEKGAVAAYKGTAEQDIAGGAVEAIKGFEGISRKQQYAINLQLKGKNVSPTEIINLTNLFKGDQKGTEALLKVLVSSPTQGNEASQVASMFIDNSGNPLKEVQKTLVLKMTSGSSGDNQENIDFFKTLGKTGEVLDMQIVSNYIEKNPNGTAALKEIFKQIQKTKGKLKIGILAKIDGMSVDEINALSTQVDYFDKLPADQQKTFTITFLSAYRSYIEDPAAMGGYLASTGMSPQAIEKQLSTAQGKARAAEAMAAAPAKQVTELEQAMAKQVAAAKKQDEQKGRDSLLDDMLKKLKLFHDSTIKATGGFQELMKVMTATGKIPINFDGTINKLRTLGEGKISEDYLRFVENLTPEQLQDKELMDQMGIKTKKGKVTGIDTKKQQKFEAGLASSEVGQNYNNTVSALVEMERRTKAINTLRLQGFSEQEANNVVSTDAIALAITQSRISQEDLDTIKLKQKELTKANFINERFTKTAQMDAAESQSKQLQMAKAYIDLQEKMIENEYIKEKTKLNIQKGDNDYALEQISRREYDINESYDKQITALEEINSLREKENELTSRKMSIAEAFASGDMSAASSAMQEYRNAKIAQSARSRMEALQKAKENAIKGVTATGSDGKAYTREDFEKMNRTIDQRFIDMENEVRVKKIELDKLTEQTTKLTKDQIDAAISTINLAVEALGPEGAAKFLDNVFETLDGSAVGTKASVKELHEEFKLFVKTMDEARIAAAGFASGNIIPNSVARANAEATAALNAKIAASDGEQKIANQKASQGFAPGKTAEQRSEQLRKDAEEVNRLYKENAELVAAQKLIDQEQRRKDFLRGVGIPGFRSGGKINGPGTGTSDSIPALLSDGEYVVNARSVDKYGVGLFESLNAQKLAEGGYLGVKNLQPDGKFERSSIAKKVVGAAGTTAGAIGNFFKEGFQMAATSFIRPVLQNSIDGANAIPGMGPKLNVPDINVLGANLYKNEGYGLKERGSDALGIGLTMANPLKYLKLIPGVSTALSAIAKPFKAVESKIAAPFKKIINLPKSRKEEQARKTAEMFDNIKNNSNNSDIWGDLPSDVLDFSTYTPFAPKSRMQTIASTIAKPLTAPANFMSNVAKAFSNSWKYGETPETRWTGSFDNYGRNSLMAELASKSIGKLAQNLNPKLTIQNKNPEEFSTLQKYMQNNLEGRYTSDPLYKNIPKNILEKFVKKPATNFISKIATKKDDLLTLLNKPNLTQEIVDSMPGGLGGLLQLQRGVHRTSTPYTASPLSVYERHAKAISGEGTPPRAAYGPGNYFAANAKISKNQFEDFGEYAYKTALTPSAILKVLGSKGLATPKDIEKIAIKYNMPGAHVTSANSDANQPIIQALIKEGYLGYRHGDAFTNWMMGTMPGMGFKLDSKSMVADGIPKSVIKKSNSISSGLKKIFEPKQTAYAATKGMKLPDPKLTAGEKAAQKFEKDLRAEIAARYSTPETLKETLKKVADKKSIPAAKISMPLNKPKKNKTTGPNYYLYQGADDDISLYHQIYSAGPKSEEGTIKGVAAILHDPFDGSLLETIGNKGSIMESFDLMALALMDAARMSGTTKTGLNTGIVSSRTDYSQKIVDTLEAKGLGKVVDIHPRIKPSFVDEAGKKTPPGSRLGGNVWLENELRFLNKESKSYDILKSSTAIPDNVVKIAKQTLLDLLKYGFDKKRVDDAVKQYGKEMNITGYAMGGIVPRYMSSGGMAVGTDTVPAMLTPGEFVVNRKATQKFGPLLSAINSPTFETPSSSTPKYSNANVSNNAVSTNNSKTLYNYNLSVNVSNSNANPNDIARTVINQIRQIDNQRIRGL